mmetsp:Transcript_22870/g.60411  ORF Transcript_22870/g.60411 Transcript_22870/m.60411 type:complete len:364 (+) Transcript_22870:576-1667(+)
MFALLQAAPIAESGDPHLDNGSLVPMAGGVCDLAQRSGDGHRNGPPGASLVVGEPGHVGLLHVRDLRPDQAGRPQEVLHGPRGHRLEHARLRDRVLRGRRPLDGPPGGARGGGVEEGGHRRLRAPHDPRADAASREDHQAVEARQVREAALQPGHGRGAGDAEHLLGARAHDGDPLCLRDPGDAHGGPRPHPQGPRRGAGGDEDALRHHLRLHVHSLQRHERQQLVRAGAAPHRGAPHQARLRGLHHLLVLGAAERHDRRGQRPHDDRAGVPGAQGRRAARGEAPHDEARATERLRHRGQGRHRHPLAGRVPGPPAVALPREEDPAGGERLGDRPRPDVRLAGRRGHREGRVQGVPSRLRDAQ